MSKPFNSEAGGAKPLSFILLAPTSVVGGITTWTRYFLARYDRRRLTPYVIDTSKRYEEIGKESNVRGTLLGVLSGMRMMAKVVGTIFAKHPRLVYLTCSGGWSFYTRDLAVVTLSRTLGMKTLIHLRGGHSSAFFGHSPLTRWLSRRIMGQVHKIIVITRKFEVQAMSLYPDKTEYLPNMLDEEVLEKASREKAPEAGRIRALHMAWQSPAKGSYDIIEACALIKDRLPGFSCDLVGRAAPEHAAIIREKIRAHGLEDRVRLRSEAVGEEKWEYFRKADFFLFPTHNEGFPNVILEAMSFGLPIITTDVGNIREMVGMGTEEESALMLQNVNPVSAAELAELILRMAREPELRARLGQRGRQRVQKKYLVREVVPQIEDLILRTME